MTTDSKYLKLTEQNFQSEVLDSSQPVLVDFWADWCGPCHMIAPAIDELALEFEGRARVGKVNVDEQPGLASRFGIRSIPTLLLFQDGRIVDQIIGAAPKSALAAKLQEVLPVA